MSVGSAQSTRRYGEMWVRVASFEGQNEEKMMEMSQQGGAPEMPAGVTRAQAWSNHEGRTKFVTYFDDRGALDAAEQAFESMGDEIPEDVRGRRTSVDVYEIVW